MSAPLSFGFSKKVQQHKLIDSKLRDESTKEEREEKDFVEIVVGNEIKGTLKREKPKEWIVPLITQNVWRKDDDKVGKSTSKQSKEAKVKSSNDLAVHPLSVSESSLTAEERLERQAISELLAQANDDGDKEVSIYEVPLLLQNRIPTGYEEDDNMDVSLRPEQSTLDDYENFPVEQFGMAMLRGMGWNKADGIGRTNKGVIELKEPTLRPKGLGLGAERPQASSKDAVPSSTKSIEQSKLTLKIGAFVIINKGSNKGSYGQVESFDEDNNRVILKLALNGKMVAVSKFYIDLVSSEEYSQKSKILNLEKYEKYKTSQEQNGGTYKRSKNDDDDDEIRNERLEDLSRRDSRRKERSDEKDFRHYEESSKRRERDGRSHRHEERHHHRSSSRTKSKKDKKSKRHRRDSSSPRERKSHKRKHRD